MDNNNSIRPTYDYARYIKETIKDENFVGKVAVKELPKINNDKSNAFAPIILVLYMNKEYVVFISDLKDKSAKVLETTNFENWRFANKQMISLKDAREIGKTYLNELEETNRKRGIR